MERLSLVRVFAAGLGIHAGALWFIRTRIDAG